MSEDVQKDKIELRSEEFQEVLGDPPHWLIKWSMMLSGIVVMIMLIGSLIFRYPEIIAAEMTLTSLAPVTSVVSKNSGRLQELRVSEGQWVNAGEYLAIIENTAITEDMILLKTYLSNGITPDEEIVLPPESLHLGEMQSLYSSFYIVLREHNDFLKLSYYQKKNELLLNKIISNKENYNTLLIQEEIIRQQYDLKKMQYQRDSLLHGKALISKEELELSQDLYLQAALSQRTMQSTLENTRMEILQLQEGLLDIKKQYLEQHTFIRSQIKTSTEQLLTQISHWEIQYALMAPVEGKVAFTDIWVVNQQISVNQNVFNIVPQQDTELIGKALLPMYRSGKVKTGQRVNVRFDNFPDNEFGIVNGVVRNISLVPLVSEKEAYYILDIDFPDGLVTTYNKQLPYLPEMSAHVEIITEDLSLFQRLIMPLKKIAAEHIL